MRILLTGATGFVGRSLLPNLEVDHDTLVATRRPVDEQAKIEQMVVGDIDGSTEWSAALAGVDVVIHLAARVHVMNETAQDALAAYRVVNTRGTLQLAEQAAAADAKRFLFVSSIKVNGEATDGQPFQATDEPEPLDPYAVSKWEAEQGLRELSAQTGMEVIVIRPPVVYGVGAGGNIQRIAGAIRRGIPLPLGAVRNARTMIAVENLVNGIRGAIAVEQAPKEPVLLGDPAPISTSDLVRLLADGLGRGPRLVPVPVPILRAAGALIGRRSDVLRLTESLEVRSNWDALGMDPPSQGAEHYMVELGRALRQQGD
jgi:UDP-glucose 4-epimerase